MQRQFDRFRRHVGQADRAALRLRVPDVSEGMARRRSPQPSAQIAGIELLDAAFARRHPPRNAQPDRVAALRREDRNSLVEPSGPVHRIECHGDLGALARQHGTLRIDRNRTTAGRHRVGHHHRTAAPVRKPETVSHPAARLRDRSEIPGQRVEAQCRSLRQRRQQANYK